LYFALPYKEKSLTRRLIRQFKYKPYIKCLAKVLAGILIENFVLTKKNTNRIWENSVLIPVPLGKNKLRERGYNQSEELAKELSKIVGVPVISNNLIKIKETLSQIELSAEERRENLRNVFEVKDIEEIIFGKPVTDSGRHPVNIRQRKIFLIDDVYTTGSTLEQCARVLRNAGAKRVWGITIARED
jgi:ComF family protein